MDLSISLQKLRRIIAAVGIFTVMSSMMVFVPATSASYHTEAYEQLLELGLVTKEDAGAALTRCAFAKLLVGATLGEPEAAEESPYSDVQVSDACAPYIVAGHDAGYWSGFPDGTYRPNKTLQRYEMMKITVMALGLELVEDADAALEGFEDGASVVDWAEPYVATAVDSGIITGKDVGGKKYISGAENVNRGQGFVVTSRVLDQAGGEEGGTEGTEGGTEGTPAEVPATPNALTAELAADTPAAKSLASGTSFNDVLRLKLTAGADADAKFTSVTVTRGGISQNSAISGVALFDAAGKRHGNVVSSIAADNTATLDFASDPVVVAKGTSTTVSVKANITAAVAGRSGTLFLSVQKAEHVKGDSATTVGGTYPLVGQTMTLQDGTNTVGALTLDAVQVFNNGAADITVVNVNLGTDTQEIAKFRIASTNANEDVEISSITLRNNGNASDGDVQKIELLAQDGTILGTVAKTSGSYAVFDLTVAPNKPYLLAKGTTRDFTVRANIVSGSTKTVRWLIENDYDVVAKGLSSAASLLPTAAGTSDTGFPIGDLIGANGINKVTIASGTLLFTRATDSPSGNISAGGTSMVLGKWKMKANGENMELRAMTYVITRSAATNLAGTFKLNIDGATFFSVSGASIPSGGASGNGYILTGGAGSPATAALSSFPSLKAGQEYVVEAVADIDGAAASGLTYIVSLNPTSLKRISTNDTFVPGGTAVASNTLTVSTASLTLARNASFANTNVVAGVSGAKVGSFSLSAGSTEDIAVSSITAALSNITNVAGLVLKTAATTPVQLGSTVTSPQASNAISIANFKVQKSQTVTIDVFLDTNSSTTGTEIVTLTISTASGVVSGASVTASGSPSIGQTITFAVNGALTVGLNTSVTPVAKILHSNMVDEPVASINLTADNNEDITLDKLQLAVTNGASTVAAGTVKLWEGTTPVGQPTNVTGGLADFGALNYKVPKDTTKTLTVSLSTTATSALNSNSTLQVSVAYVEAIGGSGGTTIKPGGTTTTAASAGAIISYSAIALTVTSNDGFDVGDVVYYRTATTAESGIGIVAAKSGTTSLSVTGGTQMSGNSNPSNIAKLATGATTAATAGQSSRAGVAITVTSTRSFAVGDPVFVSSTATTNANYFGYVQAIGDSTSMTIRSIVAPSGGPTNIVSRVSKLGASNVNTTWTATSITAAGVAITVGSTTGFNVGDMVIAQCTDQNGTFGMVTAIGTSTLTVGGNAAATLGTGCVIVRVGTNNTGLVTTAATVGQGSAAGTAHTVTSSSGFAVGDTVLLHDSTTGAMFGRVSTVATGSLTIQAQATAAGTTSRVTRLPGASSAARLMTIHDVEPTMSVAAGSPASGTKAPGADQALAQVSVKADGDRTLTVNSLRFLKNGANSVSGSTVLGPAANVTRFDLYIAGSGSPIATVGTTTLIGDTGNVAQGTTATVEFCSGSVGVVAHEIGQITAAEYAHLAAGDVLVWDDGSPTVTTIVSLTGGALAACNGSFAANATLSADPSLNANNASISIYSSGVYFDTSATSNNSGVTDQTLPAQAITAGSTLTLEVRGDTSNIRTGLTTQTTTFGLTLPGTAGSTGGLNWTYTPSGGSAITTTVSDNYPLNFGTFTY